MFQMKRLHMLLLTASLLLIGCSSLPESGIDGYTSQSKQRSDDLAAKKEKAEMKGEVVVLHACLPPPREQPEKELISRAIFSVVLFGKYPDETARFSVKEVLLGSYEESFIELTHRGGEWPAPPWRSGEYVLFFKKLECVNKSIVKIGACDYGYVDAREPLPNDPAVHICDEKVCKPDYEYSEAYSSEVFRDTGGIPFIVDPMPIKYFEKQWGLQVEPFESKKYGGKDSSASKGIRLDALRKCLKADKCMP
jgi:hypothetical protein